MKLSSAREFKQRLMSNAQTMASETRTFALRRAAAGVAPLRTEVARPVAAIGLAPMPARQREFRVVARVYKGDERRAGALIRELNRYPGETEVTMGVDYKPRITLRAGGSCGHYNITAGTLGAFVEDDSEYYLLSNNHVLADSDAGVAGDPIVQPGPADIQQRFNVVGHLARWVPLSTMRTDGVDAAIATFSDRISFFYPWDYQGVGTMDPHPVADRYSTRRVAKRGRTTGVTAGTVSAFELDGVRIDYGTRARPHIVTFDDQIEVIGAPPARPFSQPGDSGSLILDRDTLQPYALLYGGGPDSQGIDRTLAHFIGDVLDSLQIRFVT